MFYFIFFVNCCNSSCNRILLFFFFLFYRSYSFFFFFLNSRAYPNRYLHNDFRNAVVKRNKKFNFFHRRYNNFFIKLEYTNYPRIYFVLCAASSFKTLPLSNTILPPLPPTHIIYFYA